MRDILFSQTGLVFSIALGLSILAPLPLFAQDGTQNFDIPPPRTITTQLEPKPAERVVDIVYNDEKMRVCTDSYQLSASRNELYAEQTSTFRMRVTRHCGKRSQRATVPESAQFLVRDLSRTSNGPIHTEELQPNSTRFAFNYTFKRAGNYHIAIVNRYSEHETHTVSLVVSVLEPPHLL